MKKVKKKNIVAFDNELITGIKVEQKVELEKPKVPFNRFKKKVVDPNDKKDKIFGNDFNTGNIDSEHFTEIKVDLNYASSILDDCYNVEDYNEKKKLLELTVETFKNSQWKNLSLDKKFSKELQPFIFNDLFKELDGKGFTIIDIFICIAEFMDISYERIYEVAGLKMKERLINELENKYKMLSKRKINRLF